MHFNLQWLEQYLQQNFDAQDLCERLTMAGLEVDSMAVQDNALPQVITARIEKITDHPEADRLRLCQVDAGKGESYQIVCGAPNIYEGMYVALAQVGAKLGSTKIKAAKIRGVESKGMLCSAAELGLSEDQDGLLDLGEVELGADINRYIPAQDVIYKLDLTPNRSDCLSILGIAREVASLYGHALPAHTTATPAPQHKQSQDVIISEPQACPVYTAQVITGLKPGALAPFFIRERLRRCGMRSVHPVVDILNYVMLERGQPMHAFDRSKLQGHLTVRYAKDGEQMEALGEKAEGASKGPLTLTDKHLVISDEKQIHALAGVVGAKHSAVNDTTEEVVLECAYFAPNVISASARLSRLHTDASHRFERGVDFSIQNEALDYAVALISEHLGGAAGPKTVHQDESCLPQRKPISLTLDRLNRRLGLSLDSEFVESSLTSLGCQLQSANKDSNAQEYVPPNWRFDLAIEDDLNEEIARLYGYNNIPTAFSMNMESFPLHDAGSLRYADMRQCLVQSGYCEAVTYSFGDQATHDLFCDTPAVSIRNPISEEMAVLSASLWPGLVQAVSYNLARQQDRILLFQIGRVFAQQKDGSVSEMVSLAGVAYGEVMPEQWRSSEHNYDFYQIKGDVERVLSSYKDLQFRETEHKALHPGQRADIFLEGRKIGCLGQLNPRLLKHYKISMPLVLFEIALSNLPPVPTPQYHRVSSYPSIRRDLAIVLPKAKPITDLLACIKEACPPILCDISIFDIFTHKNIGPDNKSVGVGLVFQDLEQTLTKEDSEVFMVTITKAIENFGGMVRSQR